MPLWYKLFVLVNVALTALAQDSCKEGLYGNNCELTCPDRCHPLQTFPCDKSTGRCSEGCESGYHGDQCDKECSCPSGVCLQATGECHGAGPTTDRTTQNTSHRAGSTTEAPAVYIRDCEPGVHTGWRVIAAIVIAIFIIMAGCLVVLLYLRYKKKQPSSPDQRRFPLNIPCFNGIQDQEKGTISEMEPFEAQNDPGASKGLDEAAADRQGEEQKTVDDSAEINSQSEKTIQSTEIEKLKHENKQLKNEKRVADESIKQMKEQLSTLDEKNEILKNLELPENSTYHWVKSDKLDPSICLQCPQLKFDKEAVNVRVTHLDDKMVLWNIPDPRKPANTEGRFQHFHGTTCSGPLVKTGFYQYFEAVFNINLKQSIGKGVVVMQLGFCEEKYQDVNHFLKCKKNGFILNAVGCNKQKKICLVITQGDKTEQIQELMNNTPGSQKQVQIGILLNKEMKTLRVYQLTPTLKSLRKIKVEIESMWPMFGLGAQQEASVFFKLVTGRDINMSKEKKEMIRS